MEEKEKQTINSFRINISEHINCPARDCVALHL
jgi:hypothetical protein